MLLFLFPLLAAAALAQAPGPPMVEVPAGPFLMGSEEGGGDERPQRRVHLDAFWIDRHEVTNGWYGRFLKATGRGAPSLWEDPLFNAPEQPVVGVTWDDARAFCAWLGRRLPTEAEWEKAARGTEGRRYPWGEQSADCNRAIMYGGGVGCGRGRPWPVGSRPRGASPYGALDMAGNVWEWVADWYDENYYRGAPERNPKGPEAGGVRVIRGGSYYDFLDEVRAAYREKDDPREWFPYVGFRCARSP